MPTSEQDLEKIHQDNEDLRSQIAAARSAREQARASADADTRASQLLLEQANLKAQLESELEDLSGEIDIAVAVAETAAEPQKTAYQQMMEEAEAANKKAQADADEKVRRDNLTPEERQAEDDAANAAESATKPPADPEPLPVPAEEVKTEAAAPDPGDTSVKPPESAKAQPSDPPPTPPTAPTNGKGK